MKHAARPSESLQALEQFAAAVNDAKPLGDVCLDNVVDIGAYGLGQEALGAASRVASGAGQVWNWTSPAQFPHAHLRRVVAEGGTLKPGGIEVPSRSQLGRKNAHLRASRLRLCTFDTLTRRHS